eukprot:TRINITY_DN28373_c0_g1_i5.p3 TRINITY_DN28373_c0_g1~~TRINITY_DN28373_c0_g1_i5.p3  ORF type:complete len:139 (-),score=18.61 TRINITY_DN28373_c0_g1_i5:180-596(-)
MGQLKCQFILVIPEIVLAVYQQFEAWAYLEKDEEEVDELINYLSYQDGTGKGSGMRYSVSVLISLLVGSTILILITWQWWRYTQLRRLRLANQVQLQQVDSDEQPNRDSQDSQTDAVGQQQQSQRSGSNSPQPHIVAL